MYVHGLVQGLVQHNARVAHQGRHIVPVFVRLLHAVEADNTGAVPVCTGLCTCIAAECVCVKLVSIGDCAIVYM